MSARMTGTFPEHTHTDINRSQEPNRSVQNTAHVQRHLQFTVRTFHKHVASPRMGTRSATGQQSMLLNLFRNQSVQLTRPVAENANVDHDAAFMVRRRRDAERVPLRGIERRNAQKHILACVELKVCLVELNADDIAR